MKMDWKKGLLFVSVVLFVVSFTSCSDLMFWEEDEDDSIEIAGTWADTWNSFEITNDKITNTSSGSVFWEVEIAEYSNSSFNGGETGEGEYGFAVIKYTTASAYASQAQDKYGVFRWQNLDSDSIEYAECFYDVTSPGTGEYFDTAEEAKSNMLISNDSGCFYFSEIVKQ